MHCNASVISELILLRVKLVIALFKGNKRMSGTAGCHSSSWPYDDGDGGAAPCDVRVLRVSSNGPYPSS